MLYNPTKDAHQSDITVIASASFKKKLSVSLEKTYKYLPMILKDKRMDKLLLEISKKD